MALDPFAAIRRYLRFGMLLSVALVFGVGGWAVATEIAGAVIASGQFVVESNVKKVQHQTGGIVAELPVREGFQVKAGDVVAVLDDTIVKANLAIAEGNLNEMVVRQARLEAERDGTETMYSPRFSNPEIERQIISEQRLFQLRAAARKGEKSQLSQRVEQAKEQIVGLEQQIEAKQQELVFIKRELEGVRDLWRKNLIPINRVTNLEREATRIAGESGQLVAALASTRSKITETELQILQVEETFRSEVAKELREVQVKIGEAIERKVTAEDQLKRVVLRAPQDGTVYQLAVHTIGGVISPGEPVMMIVPSNDVLAVEVKIQPQDIDQVRVGQEAQLRLSALNQRTTPEIVGQVAHVGADAETDKNNGRAFYTVRIKIPPEEIERLGQARLVPGMPVEAFIKTQERTVISYLAKPLSDQINRAFRER